MLSVYDGENLLTEAEGFDAILEVSGAGTLQAFGSARPCMAESFVSKSHTTFYGRSLAVIRSGYEPGEIKVKVTGEGLESAECELYVE